jgi:glycosyltransferase involved in cell wall biosynthesis
MSLIIHAPNVHQGGGEILLVQLLRSLEKSTLSTLLADKRFNLEPPQEQLRTLSFSPSLLGRLSAEKALWSIATKDDLILCMGNLPPLFPCAGNVVIFLQNRYLVDGLPLTGMPMKVRLRIAVERVWLRTRLRLGMRMIVQTPSMQNAVKNALGRSAQILPFHAVSELKSSYSKPKSVIRFIYPATADKHKNHINLLEAWKLLYDSGVNVQLHLTVDDNQEALGLIAKFQKNGVAIINHGKLPPSQLLNLYKSCTALIFPSYVESFGLPLLEARAIGLPIIASEMDYVRDVCIPTETFDPYSPISIARAVRRFLIIPEPNFVAMSPSNFLREVSS